MAGEAGGVKPAVLWTRRDISDSGTVGGCSGKLQLGVGPPPPCHRVHPTLHPTPRAGCWVLGMKVLGFMYALLGSGLGSI